jgi:hypothetical protein
VRVRLGVRGRGRLGGVNHWYALLVRRRLGPVPVATGTRAEGCRGV